MMKISSNYKLRDQRRWFVMAFMTIHNEEFAKATEKDEGYDHEDLPDIHHQFAEKENDEGALFPRRQNEQMGNL